MHKLCLAPEAAWALASPLHQLTATFLSNGLTESSLHSIGHFARCRLHGVDSLRCF